MSKFGLVVLGAHIGIHIKGDIEKLSPEKVLLVEPVPHNVAAIKKNLIHLDNVTIEQVAISNKNEIKNNLKFLNFSDFTTRLKLSISCLFF